MRIKICANDGKKDLTVWEIDLTSVTFDEFLSLAQTELELTEKPKYVFLDDGARIKKMNSIKEGDVLIFSIGSQFIKITEATPAPALVQEIPEAFQSWLDQAEERFDQKFDKFDRKLSMLAALPSITSIGKKFADVPRLPLPDSTFSTTGTNEKFKDLDKDFDAFIERVNRDTNRKKLFTKSSYDEISVAQPFFTKKVLPFLNSQVKKIKMVDTHDHATLGLTKPDCAIATNGSLDMVHFLCVGDIKSRISHEFSENDQIQLFDYMLSLASFQPFRFHPNLNGILEAQVVGFLTDIYHTQLFVMKLQKSVNNIISILDIRRSTMYTGLSQSIGVLRFMVYQQNPSIFHYEFPTLSLNGITLEVDSFLGSGSTAFVVKGSLGDKCVAIKCSHGRRTMSYLQHEATVLNKLKNIKYISRIEGVGDSFIATSPVGQILSCHSKHFINESDASPLLQVHHLVSLVEILQAIHQYSIIHRDLKPSNFIIHGDEFYLIDFGCSVDLTSPSSIDDDGVYNGCKIFAPDEVLLDTKHSPSILDDLMSVVYLYMCTLDHALYDKLCQLRDKNLEIINLRNRMMAKFGLTDLVNSLSSDHNPYNILIDFLTTKIQLL